MKLSKNEQKKLAELFLEACRIDNPTGDEELIAKWTTKKMGAIKATVEIDNYYNVLFKLPGTGEPILLNAHLDSVNPAKNKNPQFDGKKFTSDGNTVLGADNLVGVVSILFAILSLKKHKLAHRPLEILFTSQEEIGGEGVKNFDLKKLKAKKGIVADSIAPVGNIVIKTSSKYNFRLRTIGKAMHGSKVGEGINAIKMLAECISGIPVGRLKSGMRINIGKISGGHSLNTVPGEACLAGEIRVDTKKKYQEGLDMINEKMRHIESRYPKGKIKLETKLVRPAYNLKKSDPWIKELLSIIKSLGLSPTAIESKGVSDANTLIAKGKKAILIGTGVKGAHTKKESVELSSIVKLTELIIEICRA